MFDGVIVACGHSPVTVERATESAKELAVVKLETSSPSTRAAAETAADRLPVSRRSHMTAMGLGCVKTLEPPIAQCIFGHAGPISRDYIDSKRALSHLRGMCFGFSHILGQFETFE